jgi:protein O-mannosyl-transferase
MHRPATKPNSISPRVSAPVVDRSRLLVWLFGMLLVLLTMALYWPATRCAFVNFDDNLYVTSNVHVQSGLTWQSIKWAGLNIVADNWHPLTVLSHMLVCQVFGLNPWGHHLTNVLLHALNAGLVFALLQQMTGARWRSLLAAALFAVHPLRVESVAWVSERKDVLSGCFGLLALISYARYARDRRPTAESGMQDSAPSNTQLASRFTFHVSSFKLQAGTFYLLSLFFFAVGLMSKPMLVTWPFAMLLLDYWPLGRIGERGMRNANSRITVHGSRFTLQVPGTAFLPLVLEKLPFFALAASASVVTFVVQQHGSSLAMGENLPLGARIGNALISYCRHLGRLFWPTNLAAAYPHPGQWPLGKVLLAGGLLLGISALVWMQRRRFPFLLMGWLWFVGMLVPVIGLVQTGGQAMADRHTYLPSLGVLILAIWGACEVTRRWRHQLMALSVAGAGAIVLCLGLTRQQLGYWRDSETLFRHALEVTESNLFAHYSLGLALGEKGQTDEAIRQYQEALHLKPDDTDLHNNLGNALAKKGKSDEAIRHYQEAIRLKPDYALAHYNLGIAFFVQGRNGAAIRQFQEALRLNPDLSGARNNLDFLLDTEANSPKQPSASAKP